MQDHQSGYVERDYPCMDSGPHNPVSGLRVAPGIEVCPTLGAASLGQAAEHPNVLTDSCANQFPVVL